MSIINDIDKIINYTFLDANLEPIDTAIYTGIIAKVYQKGVEIDKFSLNTQTGFGAIVRQGVSTLGVIEFYLNAEKLRQGVDGFELFYEIKTEKANTDFENDTEESSTGEISLGKLTKTELTNTTFS